MNHHAAALILLVGLLLAACQPANLSDDDYASGNVNPISGNRAGTGQSTGR